MYRPSSPNDENEPNVAMITSASPAVTFRSGACAKAVPASRSRANERINFLRVERFMRYANSNVGKIGRNIKIFDKKMLWYNYK